MDLSQVHFKHCWLHVSCFRLVSEHILCVYIVSFTYLQEICAHISDIIKLGGQQPVSSHDRENLFTPVQGHKNIGGWETTKITKTLPAGQSRQPSQQRDHVYGQKSFIYGLVAIYVDWSLFWQFFQQFYLLHVTAALSRWRLSRSKKWRVPSYW